MGAYEWAHERVYQARGSASSYSCTRCGEPAQEWAYNHSEPDPDKRVQDGRTFSGNVNAYMPLCHSCHVRFDKGDRCVAGHEFSPENTYLYEGHRYCKTCRYEARRRYREGLPDGHPDRRPYATAREK